MQIKISLLTKKHQHNDNERQICTILVLCFFNQKVYLVLESEANLTINAIA